MDIYNILLFGCVLFYCQGTKSEVLISPNNLTLLEGNNATVRCKYHGQNRLQGAFFTFYDSIVAQIFLPNCTFNVAAKENYRTDCEGNTTFTLTLINVSRYDHGKQVRCTIFLNNGPENSRNTALVYINVPVKSVPITSPTIEDGILSICENVNISLHCETSASRPAAIINWIYQSKSSTGDITTVTVNSNTSVKEENYLFITSSTLYIVANRSLNSWYIFCSSSNNQDNVVNSSIITFDILYPPDQPPTIIDVNVTNGATYRIIEGRQGVLTCAVQISNPNATLTWTGLGNRHKIVNNLNFVSNNLEWVASRHEKNMSTCFAKHECSTFTISISVKIVVLYPPTIKPMKDVSIVEGSLLNITCDITFGIPETVTINWTRQTDILITNSRFLTIQSISRDFSSNYTCNVSNIMKPTIGIEEIGESSSSFYLDVLYPPIVDPIKNQTVTEGSDFNLSCPVNPGNPNTTYISWTSIDRRIQRTTYFLSFKNISRNHAEVYTCTALNIMDPTNNFKVKGYDSESFHLIVEYRATIKQFSINGYKTAVNVTLNEHDNITFHCNVDSLPTSTTDIKFQNGSKLKSTNSTNNVSYYLGPATCLDSGIYECSGRNKHNSMQENPKKQLAVFVNCFPRPHPKTQVRSNITTALNVPLVLSFTAVAYPLPTTVNWQKFNGSNWTNIMSYNDTLIRKSNLIFNLTIQNVKQKDLGKYKLVIINDIDEFEQPFTIIPADIPKPPTTFRVLSKEISTSSITVGWFPSFNGGQPQHFILNISKSDEQLWTSHKVEDTGDTYLNYTYEGLMSGTSYKFNIYAENTIGRSNVSDTLLFKTKDQDDQHGSTLGTAVGVVSGFVGGIGTVVLVICFFRKRLICTCQKESKDVVYENDITVTPSSNSNTNEYEHIRMHKQITLRKQTGKNSSDKVGRHSSEVHYESLEQSKREHEYSQLSGPNERVEIITNNSSLNAVGDEHYTENNVPVYTNLKL